ncbi:ABC transporter permease protein YxdM [Lentibacillus sp. JNUCC-1]|uniref:ABC transporter permease n=1 Tax=Lentibacillus sp. JNUCC-1 TaxID=2654513 RepID=UPI0012E7B2CC|nr:ABC transporter permease [Lentibacillus sp. JNUCC-1]MUV37112.1 ABC transporter permease protein YxdM [Lentibacillus sp. JNUCC-1]
MTFRQFVVNNVLRNKRLYAAYFLSSMFTVMIFFTFAIFAFHPALTGDTMRSEVMYGMGIAGGIIYVFSLFFVLYSMSAFLQSRKKEFGLLMMQGMSMRQVRLMVFLENMLIGLLATVIGIGIGLLFAKAILMIAEKVLIIEQALHFYFPLLAIIITFVSFTLLFLIISFFVTFFLRSRKLTELIKGSQKPKEEPKASVTLTIIAALLLGAGYVTALWAKGAMVIYVMLPVIVVVILGTYLFFTQLSVYLIHRLKKRKAVFWKKTNMLLLSDLSFRMKDNARTFFMVAVISTVAFSAIGTLFGFQTYLTSGMKETNPYSFTYFHGDMQDEADPQKDIQTIESTLDQYNIEAEKTSSELQYYTISGERTLVVSASMYNQFADVMGAGKVSVENGEALAVQPSDRVLAAHGGEKDMLNNAISLQNGDQLTPARTIENEAVLPELRGYYIVAEADYQQLPEPESTEKNWVWKAADGQSDAVVEAGTQLMDEVPPFAFQAIDAVMYMINKTYGPILFVGLFIGIVFFVAAGSFLYFRLYSDLDEDKAKFSAIAKMGLTDKELGKVINRQTAILFFAPIAVALIHGAVALTALAHFFEYQLFTESGLVLGGFLGIQIVYFVVVRYLYSRQIKSVL